MAAMQATLAAKRPMFFRSLHFWYDYSAINLRTSFHSDLSIDTHKLPWLYYLINSSPLSKEQRAASALISAAFYRCNLPPTPTFSTSGWRLVAPGR